MILLISSDFCDKTHEGKTIRHKVRSKLTPIKNKLMSIKENEIYLILSREDSHFVHREIHNELMDIVESIPTGQAALRQQFLSL